MKEDRENLTEPGIISKTTAMLTQTPFKSSLCPFLYACIIICFFQFQAEDDTFVPVTVNRKVLKMMEPTSILVCKWPPPLRYQFYRNLLPDLQVTTCMSCNKVQCLVAHNIYLFCNYLLSISNNVCFSFIDCIHSL